jgi:hypothetical protein
VRERGRERERAFQVLQPEPAVVPSELPDLVLSTATGCSQARSFNPSLPAKMWAKSWQQTVGQKCNAHCSWRVETSGRGRAGGACGACRCGRASGAGGQATRAPGDTGVRAVRNPGMNNAHSVRGEADAGRWATQAGSTGCADRGGRAGGAGLGRRGRSGQVSQALAVQRAE